LHVGDRDQLAWFYSAPMAGNLSAVDKVELTNDATLSPDVHDLSRSAVEN
jgi:hypothetical protein